MNRFDNPDFLNLPGAARGLFAAAAERSFFNLPEWYDLVARHGLEPGWRTRLYVSDQAALVTCVPAAGSSREIRGCSNMYTIEHSPLGPADGNVRQLVADIARDKPSPEAILLPGLDPQDRMFAGLLAGLKDSGCIAKPYFAWGTWFEPTEGRDFDAYLAARPSVLKNTWRRKLASLEKTARVVFQTTNEMDLERFIAAYDEVYRRSWKVPEPFADFMPALMRMAERIGALRYGVLESDEQPIAAQFWIVWRGRAIIYKLANDEKWGKFSPGTLLTMHMIRHVLEQDHPAEINFGRGDDDYKKLWMSERRERWGIEAANPRSARGLGRAARLMAAKARAAILNRG
jgi:hypothetical protein